MFFLTTFSAKRTSSLMSRLEKHCLLSRPDRLSHMMTTRGSFFYCLYSSEEHSPQRLSETAAGILKFKMQISVELEWAHESQKQVVHLGIRLSRRDCEIVLFEYGNLWTTASSSSSMENSSRAPSCKNKDCLSRGSSKEYRKRSR